MKKINDTTYSLTSSVGKPVSTIEAVIGDEKQPDFYPRLKIKKWNNEVNLSIGLAENEGKHSVAGDTISYETPTTVAEFYPLQRPERPAYNSAQARFVDLGAISPARLAAVYELDEHIPNTKQTIFHYTANQPTLLYWGSYARETFLDTAKIDIAEARLYDMRVGTNDPMYSDEGLHWFQINFDGEDVLTPFQTAIKNVLTGKGFELKQDDGKMYFKDGEKWVKFYSQATMIDKSFFYINLDNDYNKAYDYHNTDTPEIRDLDAYGLGIDAGVIDEFVAEYQQLIGKPVVNASLTNAEEAELTRLEPFVSDRGWVEDSIRQDVTPFHVDDAFEFAITLKEQPDSNVIPLTVTTKGLDFTYQPSLTVEERFDSTRPQHVIGSYAAYHKTKMNNEYQTGKAFHIYRPWAEDANGNRVWCEFDPDWDYENDQPLNITVPQDFLDNATYPVLIDPTFGYTSAGGSAYAAAVTNRILALDTTSAPTDGVIDSIAIYRSVTSSSSGTSRWKTALYDSSGNFIEGTTEKTSTVAIAAAWETTSALNSTSFASGSMWITMWGVQASYTWPVTYYDTGTSAGFDKGSVNYVNGNGGWPNPLTAGSDVNYKFSFYVNYTYTFPFPQVVFM